MDDYLIDRETLGKFVDELKNQTPSAEQAEELNAKREEIIEALDEKIGLAIFSKFTPNQNDEFNHLLEREDATEADFQSFFDRIGLDVEQIATDTMKNFAQELLGGQNA